MWPNVRHVELQVFGSFANGLSTWCSDLDLVVAGVMEPDRVSGGERADPVFLLHVRPGLTQAKD